MAEKKSVLPLSFHGEGGALFSIHIINIFLTIITLGVYHFWAKVKLRKYLWSQFELDGDRLGYHATGGEMLRGWIKAALIFGIPYILLAKAPGWLGMGKAGVILGGLAAFLLMLVFFPFAMVGTRRYRLSRTSWRNVRFSFRGKIKELFIIYLKGTLLSLLTLGFYSPFYSMNLHEFLTGKTYFGNRKFNFNGKGEDLFGSFALAYVLMIPTLFLSMVWYGVKQQNYAWEHTHLGDAHFNSTITFWGMLGLHITNFLLVLVTLGFGFSWAEARYFRYITSKLSLVGDAALETVTQEALDTDATGEELAGFLDLDFTIG